MLADVVVRTHCTHMYAFALPHVYAFAFSTTWGTCLGPPSSSTCALGVSVVTDAVHDL